MSKVQKAWKARAVHKARLERREVQAQLALKVCKDLKESKGLRVTKVTVVRKAHREISGRLAILAHKV